MTRKGLHRFKRRRYGRIETVSVDLLALVLDWVRGAPLKNLAGIHLLEVQGGDEDAFRFEQLSTFLTHICAHHLPFTLGTVLAWINTDRSDEVNPSLPAHLHYGVPDAKALELLTSGVRSRRIAAVVGKQAASRWCPRRRLATVASEHGTGPLARQLRRRTDGSR